MAKTEDRYLIVQDTKGRVYLITPDRLGPPVEDPTLSKSIADYIGKARTPVEGVTFALMIGEADMIVRICGNNGPPTQPQGGKKRRPPP
jgi:hypothetical protein